MERIERTGMNSIRFWYCSAWSFYPGSSPIASRIVRGITTWNYGDTVTTNMRDLIDTSKVCG